jgi:CspA family cold shock protein
MSDQSQSIVCQQCGRGFVVTAGYHDFLARRGVKTPVQCMTCFLKEGPLPKQRGKIKWFNSRKHYGFIITDEGQEVFLHRQQLLGEQGNEPREGQTALFHARHAKKGPEALNVELIQE